MEGGRGRGLLAPRDRTGGARVRWERSRGWVGQLLLAGPSCCGAARHEGAITVVNDVVEPALPVTSVEEGAGKAETEGGLGAAR